MQLAFTLLLTGLLITAVVYFLVMGFSQRRRHNALARRAHAMRMRFSLDDLFDIPRRYEDFALISSGHSPCVHNIIYGRLNGYAVRAFDFRYEAGHGTQRLTRHYGVIIVETGSPMPSVLMWNEKDDESVPLAARRVNGRIGGWGYVGPRVFAAALQEVCGPLAKDAASIQTRGAVFMLCVPIKHRQQDCTGELGRIVDALQALVQPPDKVPIGG